MKIAIISDVHGNKKAMESVRDSLTENMDAVILLGDMIDYGPHSNEVVGILKQIKIPILCNIWGNHESAIVNNVYDRFSSERGRESAKYTRNELNDETWQYLKNVMTNEGRYEFVVEGKKCLATHGSLQDEYWKAIKPEHYLEDYKDYDYVFSGHSHLPHVFENFYECNNLKMRNKKKTVFINPGSVGQPRNHNSCAQYALLDTTTGEVQLKCILYDIKKEQMDFSNKISSFYRDRLEVGV